MPEKHFLKSDLIINICEKKCTCKLYNDQKKSYSISLAGLPQSSLKNIITMSKNLSFMRVNK